MKAECAQLRRRQGSEVSRRRRDVQPLAAGRADLADDRLLQAPRALCLDQLTAEGAQERVGHRPDTDGTQSAQRAAVDSPGGLEWSELEG